MSFILNRSNILEIAKSDEEKVSFQLMILPSSASFYFVKQVFCLLIFISFCEIDDLKAPLRFSTVDNRTKNRTSGVISKTLP